MYFANIHFVKYVALHSSANSTQINQSIVVKISKMKDNYFEVSPKNQTAPTQYHQASAIV